MLSLSGVKTMRLRLASLVVLLFASVSAFADTVTFTLLNPTQSVTSAGGTLSFNASVSAPRTNTGSEDLNSLVFNINPPSGLTPNADPFLNEFPLTLAPGDSYSDLLFTLLVPAGSPVNTYLGSVLLYGGPSNSVIGTQNFSVNVTPSIAVTPEPSSLLLLGTGVAGMATAFRRRFAGSAAR